MNDGSRSDPPLNQYNIGTGMAPDGSVKSTKR